MNSDDLLREKSHVNIAPDLAFWFPFQFCIHVRNGRYLIIAPDKPGWMTLSKTEYAFFQNLLAGRTIRQSIRLVMADLNISLIETVEAAYGVLNKIDSNGFLEVTEKTSVISRQILLRLSQAKIPFPYPRLESSSDNPPQAEAIRELFSAMRALCPPGAVYRIRYVGWEKYRDNLLPELLGQARDVGLKNILVCGAVPPLRDEIFQLTDQLDIHLNYRNRIRRRAGSIGPVIRNAGKAVIRVFLTSKNAATVRDEIFNCLDAIDPEKKLPVRVSVYPPSGTNLILQDQNTDRQLYQVAREIRNRLFDQGRMLFRSDPRFFTGQCCDFGRDLAVGPDGKVYPCPYSKTPIADLSTDSHNDVLKWTLDLHRDASVQNLSECGTCDLRNICQGRCRLDYFRDGHIDRNKIHCSHQFREQVYDRLMDDELGS